MNAVEKDVDTLILKELENANLNFPLFHSPHEGYAVIKEEVEEAQCETKIIDQNLDDCWYCIKKNRSVHDEITRIKNAAKRLAIEAIQVAAMCEKYNMSITNKKDDGK